MNQSCAVYRDCKKDTEQGGGEHAALFDTSTGGVNELINIEYFMESARVRYLRTRW